MMRTIRHMVLALCSVFILCGTVHAAESPLAVLQTQIDQILNVLKEPNYKDPIKRVPLRAQIEKYVHEIFDFSEFSARTVGRNWPNLLLITYLDKIQGYNGEKIEYSGEVLSTKGDRAEIQTIVTLSDGKPVPVAYRMMLKNGKWVVYDVLIENVSLIKNYRSQFQDVLTRGTPEQLIERVEARARELQAQSTVN